MPNENAEISPLISRRDALVLAGRAEAAAEKSDALSAELFCFAGKLKNCSDSP